MRRTRTAFIVSLLSLAILSAGCARSGSDQPSDKPQQLVVFNAGSLTAPVADLLAAFSRLHPGVTPQQESSGSLDAARKITDLNKPCDLLAVADYEVIPSLLIPNHASWYLIFA